MLIVKSYTIPDPPLDEGALCLWSSLQSHWDLIVKVTQLKPLFYSMLTLGSNHCWLLGGCENIGEFQNLDFWMLNISGFSELNKGRKSPTGLWAKC